MFTGIIEELGTVRSIKRGVRSSVLEIAAEKILEDIHLGDSIAVNGVCLTASSLTDGGFRADVMPETMSRSSLSQLSAGSHVNLERAMAANGRFGGHIVSGHIDGISLTVAKIRADGFSISAIPHTVSVTTLGEKTRGSIVNLETDIIGKYVEKLLQPTRQEKQGGSSMEFLASHGF